jgi:hypothetical protein
MYGLKPVPFKKVLTQGAKALPAFAAGMYGLKPAPFAQGSFLQPLPQQPF